MKELIITDVKHHVNELIDLVIILTWNLFLEYVTIIRGVV